MRSFAGTPTIDHLNGVVAVAGQVGIVGDDSILVPKFGVEAPQQREHLVDALGLEVASGLFGQQHGLS